MSREESVVAPPDAREVSSLIETLLAAEARLVELTGGEVDSIAGNDGIVFLLRGAQEQVLRSEAAKQASLMNELRVVFDLLPAMIWVKDTNNGFHRVNRRAAEATGMTVAEIEGKSAYEIYPRDAQGYFADDLEVIHSGVPKLGYEETVRTRDGREVWVRTDKVPYYNAEDKVIGLVVLSFDITEHRRLELERRAVADEIARRERIFNDAFAAMTDFVQIYDREGRIEFINQPLLNLWGLQLDDVVGRNFSELDYPADLAVRLLGELREVVETRKIVTGETTYTSPTGRCGNYEYIFSPSFGDQGEVDRIIGTTRDTTERKLAERRLLRINEHHAALSKIAVGFALVRSREELYETVCRTFVEVDPIDLTVIVEVDQAALTDGLLVTSGLSDEARNELASLTRRVDGLLPSDPVASVCRTGEETYCNDIAIVDLEKPWREFAERYGLRSHAAFPVKLREVTIAVLILYSREEDYFQEDEIHIMESVATSISLAVEAMDQAHQRELAVLERNKANEALQRSLGETERTVQERTAELASANAELQIALKRADAANRAKSEFLSNMSHELRTPLNAVLGNAQLLELQYDTPYIVDAARSIRQGGDHLLRMISEILDLSQIESGNATISVEPVSVSEAIENAIGLVQSLAVNAGIEIQVSGNDSDTHVLADRQKLLQVLVNLLSNAIKYNRPEGRVQVRCEIRSDGLIGISISDCGHGVDVEAQHLLFKPFQRLGVTNVEGTGLGLALSKRFVEMMGGALELTSSSSEGSTFSVHLQRAGNRYAEMIRQKPDEATKLTTHKSGTVLLVEDNLSNLRLLELAFSHCGSLKLISAKTGAAGIELAEREQPDVIMLDLHLPDMRGQEVLRLLKSNDSTQSIPVVVVSADATREVVHSLRAAGAMEYLTKPVDLKQLFVVLDEILPEKDQPQRVCL